MKAENKNVLDNIPEWFSSAILVVLLYLMYSSTFLSDYLMNDERGVIGRETVNDERGVIGRETGNVISAISSYYYRYGRGLFGLYQKLVYDFVGFDTGRIQLIRFVNFSSIAIIAVALLKFLEKKMKDRLFAFFTILFFLSQLPFQGLMGYSLQLFSNSQPSMWLSLLAFYLFFFVFERRRISYLLQAGTVLLILLLAMQSTQTYAFFGIIPAAYLALSDWKNKKRRILTFILIAVVVFVISILAYQTGLNFLSLEGGQEAYDPGERGLSELFENPIKVILIAINPRTYWSVFKFWTFPFPIQNLPPILNIVKKYISLLLMTIWFGIVIASIFIEIKRASRNERLAIISKWLTVLGCFGLGAVFIIADSPLEIVDHKPHFLLTFSGLVIFTGAYAIEVITSRYSLLQNGRIRAITGIVILMTAFGAQAGVLRNIVNIHARQIDFIRQELLVKNPDSYDTVIVILPKWNKCVTEPCGPWFGWSTDPIWELRRPGAYRYALATIGTDPTIKELIYVYYNLPTDIPPNAVVVDWNDYSKAQERSADYFKSKWLGSTFPFLVGE